MGGWGETEREILGRDGQSVKERRRRNRMDGWNEGRKEGKEREEKIKLKIYEFFYVDKMKRCKQDFSKSTKNIPLCYTSFLTFLEIDK